jgi:DNA invertase Pin-like site-specific DNA recombinase
VEKNKLKIGIYCRVSSLKQTENTSLKNQKDNGIKFCKNNGYEYEIFSETVSGGKEFSDRNMFNS